MKIIFAILILFSFQSQAQITSFILRGDTLFALNPSTGEERQLTKLVTSTGVISVLGYTPANVTALDLKSNILTANERGTITQATSKTTGVTLNKLSGQITMNGAALAAAAEVTFTVTNSLVTTNDVPVVSVQSVGTAGAYLVSVGAVANGSFSITVSNASAGSLSQAIILNYIIIKG